MTRNEFIEKYRYELAGLVFEFAMTERSGGERAMQFRLVMTRVDTMLRTAWQAAHPEEVKPEESKPEPPKPQPPRK